MSLMNWNQFVGQRAPAALLLLSVNLLASGSGSCSKFPLHPRRQAASLTSLPASPEASLTRGPTTSGANFVTTCLSLCASRASLLPVPGLLLLPSITLLLPSITIRRASSRHTPSQKTASDWLAPSKAQKIEQQRKVRVSVCYCAAQCLLTAFGTATVWRRGGRGGHHTRVWPPGATRSRRRHRFRGSSR